ncbi:MAG: OB-fold domain-containing protein [Chloroflexi bacterium]|nr:OB-fold domain-containing protein [Chloroflexota bacterium]
MSWKQLVVPTNFDEDILPFWDGLTEHQFRLFRCTRCGAHYWPMAYCRKHEDIPRLDEMEWTPTSGQGTVFSWVIVHQVMDQAYADELPYALVLVELAEGPIFPTRITGCDPHDVKEGLPVEVAYTDVPETGMTLPLFRPRS